MALSPLSAFDNVPAMRQRVEVADDEAAAPRRWLDLDAALAKVEDLFFACCVGYPSDEELERRLKRQCRALEASLAPTARRHFRSERDCLLARLGFSSRSM